MRRSAPALAVPFVEALEPRLLLDGALPGPAEFSAASVAGHADHPAVVVAQADSQAVLTSLPSSYQVVLDPARTFQTMDGIGANAWALAYGSSGAWDWNAVKFVFDELDLHYIRMCPWLGWWETTNDNGDPWTTNWSAFGQPNNFAAWWEVPFAKYLTGKGIAVDLWVGGFADWVRDGQSKIPPHMFAEAGEYLATYVKNLVNNGVPQPVTELMNEPDIGNKYANAYQARDAAKILLQQLDRLGLTDTMLRGPSTHRPAATAAWAEVWLADPILRERMIAVSYHTWWDASRAPYEAIREVAERYGKPVWAGEVGYIATNIHPEEWSQAMDFARSHYRAMAWSNASRSYHWSVIGHDAVVSPTGERYPTFYTLKHYSNFIAPGAVRLEALSNHEDSVAALSFARPDGRISLILLNNAQQPRTVDLLELGGGSYRIAEGYTTTASSYYSPVAPTAGDSLLTVQLPPSSISSYILEAAAGLPGDINGDGTVNTNDLGILLSRWGQSGVTIRQGDVNGDGQVNTDDLALLLGHWGMTSATGAEPTEASEATLVSPPQPTTSPWEPARVPLAFELLGLPRFDRAPAPRPLSKPPALPAAVRAPDVQRIVVDVLNEVPPSTPAFPVQVGELDLDDSLGLLQVFTP